MGITLGIRAALWLAGALLVAILAATLWAWSHHGEKAAAQAAQDHGSAVVAQAGTKAAQDAVKVVVDDSKVVAAIRGMHDENEAAIRAAKGSDQQLDPAVAAAAVRGLCRYESQRDDPSCAAVQQPHP